MTSERAPPLPRLPTLLCAQRSDPKPREERTSSGVLGRPESAYRLLDVDRARVRSISGATQEQQPPARLRATAQQIDQHSRIEQNRRQLPNYPTRR